MSIDMAFMEEYVGGATCEFIREGRHFDLLREAVDIDGAADLAAQLNLATRELEDFRRLSRGISPESYLAYVSAKEAEIGRLTEALATALKDNAATEVPRLPGDLATTIEEHWHDADPAWKRMLVQLCWKEVLVCPAVDRSRWSDPARRVVLVPRTTIGPLETV